jgi:hypothetical protein
MAEEARLVRLCGKCAAEVPGDASFCPSCGTPARADENQGESVGEMLVEFATGTAKEIRKTGRTVLKSETGKKVVAGAAIGAVAAVAIPFVSMGVGALVGAGIVAFRRRPR